MNILTVNVNSIRTISNRDEGGLGDIKSLAANIKEFGQISAVTLVATPEETMPYRVIDGRRRIAAFRWLDSNYPDEGWSEITADVFAVEELGGSEEEIAISANIARLEMDPLDEGIAFAKMLDAGKDAGEVAAIFCRNKAQVFQRAKLARLPDGIKCLYRSGKIETTTALQIATIDRAGQELVAEKVADYIREKESIYNWNVREILNSVRHDLLDKFCCDTCTACTKRTHYDDTSLFPELQNDKDRCLDHDCYVRTWRRHLEEVIRSAGLDDEKLVDNFIVLSYANESILDTEAGGDVELCGRTFRVVSSAYNGDADIYFNKKICREITHTGIAFRPSGAEKVEFIFKKDEKRCKKEASVKDKEKERDKLLSCLPQAVRDEIKSKVSDKKEASLLASRAMSLAMTTCFNNPDVYRNILHSYVMNYRHILSDDILAEFGIKAEKGAVPTDDEWQTMFRLIPVVRWFSGANLLDEIARSAKLAFAEIAQPFSVDEFKERCVRDVYSAELAEHDDESMADDDESAAKVKEGVADLSTLCIGDSGKN